MGIYLGLAPVSVSNPFRFRPFDYSQSAVVISEHGLMLLTDLED